MLIIWVASSPATSLRTQALISSFAAVSCVSMSTNLNWVTCILARGRPKRMRCSAHSRVCSQTYRADEIVLTHTTSRSS